MKQGKAVYTLHLTILLYAFANGIRSFKHNIQTRLIKKKKKEPTYTYFNKIIVSWVKLNECIEMSHESITVCNTLTAVTKCLLWIYKMLF